LLYVSSAESYERVATLAGFFDQTTFRNPESGFRVQPGAELVLSLDPLEGQALRKRPAEAI
jgi:hypothetical protein